MKKISKREFDVLELIKQGLRNPEIANELGLSTKTIENHVRSMLAKTGTRNRVNLVVTCLKQGILVI